MCENCEEIKTKVCRNCGEEKPIGEFTSKGSGFYDYQCKVCKFLSKRHIIYEGSTWSPEIDRIIIDHLLNKKSKTINEICMIINRDLKDVCWRINNTLSIKNTVKLVVELLCPQCKHTFQVKPCVLLDEHDEHFCSRDCHTEWMKLYPTKKRANIEKTCVYCGKEFIVGKSRKTQKYCSTTCKAKDMENKVTKSCVICGSTFEVKFSTQDKSATCSKNCSKIYQETLREKRAKSRRVQKECVVCGNEYTIVKSRDEREGFTSKFCSNDCKNQWQKENKRGENHPSWSRELIKCEWCDNEFYEKQYKLNNDKHHFCSVECRKNWFIKIYSQTDEFKKQRAIIAVESLEKGNVPTIDTLPQRYLNNILYDLNVINKNEKAFEYYSVDNYLIEHNLIIECMGTYWHCDNRFYDTIQYEMQLKRIRTDKAKKHYIKNQYNIEILYLWEEDILYNTDLVIELIKTYINNKGELLNYHSFNYTLRGIQLELNQDLIMPYMDWNAEEIAKITDMSVKEKMCKKQLDKWTQFKCENCGKDCEELTSHYKKKNHHFCSIECCNNFNITKVTVQCNSCGNNIEVINSKFKKQRYFFCNKDCQHDFQKKIGFKRDGITVTIFECEQCGAKTSQNTSDYSKSKHHFCSKACSAKYKASKIKGRTMKEFACENCGKLSTKKLGDYNKSKNHFCCYECAIEFRRNLK